MHVVGCSGSSCRGRFGLGFVGFWCGVVVGFLFRLSPSLPWLIVLFVVGVSVVVLSLNYIKAVESRLLLWVRGCRVVHRFCWSFSGWGWAGGGFVGGG